VKQSRDLGTTIGPVTLKRSYSWLARSATSGAIVGVKNAARRESDTLGSALQRHSNVHRTSEGLTL
jgi:hypothetical protein